MPTACEVASVPARAATASTVKSLLSFSYSIFACPDTASETALALACVCTVPVLRMVSSPAPLAIPVDCAEAVVAVSATISVAPTGSGESGARFTDKTPRLIEKAPAVALALASDFTRPLFRIISSPPPPMMPVTAAFASVPAPARPVFGVGIVISNSEMPIPTPNIGLAGAGTEANAAATGIIGGGGDDMILNSGLVKSDASASATAGAFSISLGVLSLNLAPDSPLPVGATLIVADTATTASAQ